jgi:hypothetical protein
MRKLIFALLLIPLPALAIETADCAAATQLAAFYELRSLMLKPYTSSYDVDNFIDRKLDELREPLSGGGFRWVHWVRPSRDPEYDKHGHNVVAVEGSGTDHFEASGDHAFAARIAVPSKRSLFNGNNPVYVGTVHVRYNVNGRERMKDEPINHWMNPDTSRTIDLGTIADHVDVSLDSSTAQGNAKSALVEIHLLRAVAEDDPGNPNYPAITALMRVRGSFDRDVIDDEIAKLEPAGSIPLYRLVRELRHADELMRSNKQDDKDKGEKLLKETLRRLR